MTKRPVVAMLLFDQVEVLDFAGPYEVFAGARTEAGEPYWRALTVGLKPVVTCFGGLRVQPDALADACPPLDVLVVPGGPGARQDFGEHAELIAFIQRQARAVPLVASVCTGACLLAQAGLLHGRRATTHAARMALFQERFPHVQAIHEKIVDEGSIITAGGVSSGIDLALYLLERFHGADARRREARRLEGPWR